MTRDVSDITHRKRRLRFERSQLVEFCLGRRRLTLRARRSQADGLAAGVAHDGGADGKVSIEKCYLSPYVEKPFNSKVIKSFVPELKSRKCFFVFRDSYVIYEHFMNIICTFHIFMYDYVTRENISAYIHPYVYARICIIIQKNVQGLTQNYL